MSAAAARQLYGVVLDHAGNLDRDATAAACAAIRDARLFLVVAAEADGFVAGAVSKRRVCRLHPDDAARLQVRVDDIVELDGGTAAPLRAWGCPDPAVAQGTVPLDKQGQSILACAPGKKLLVRKLAFGTPT